MITEHKQQLRNKILDYFRQVARDENARNNIKPVEFWDLIDKTTGRKRILLICKESFGDCLLITQLFESLHQQYPNHDLYIAVDGKFAEIFKGNPYIFKILQYQPVMENELAMTGSGDGQRYFDVFLHPAIPTQRQLAYLTSTTAAMTPYLDLP